MDRARARGGTHRLARGPEKGRVKKLPSEQIKVGTYDLGWENVDVFVLTREQGGCYYFQPEDGHFARTKKGTP